MAKSQRKSKRVLSTAVTPSTPLRARLAEKVVIVLDVQKEAHAIVAQVLTHFGAGYGAARQNENPEGAPSNVDIFANPGVLSSFHALLVNSTIDHFPDAQWDAPPIRAQVLQAAFEHGVLARQRVVTDGTGTLSLLQILDTLMTIQSSFCPGVGGAGGGPICRF